MKLFYKIGCFFLAGVLVAGCSYYSYSDQVYVESLKAQRKFWNWEAEGIRVHYVEKGEGGRHVLLLHGFGAHTFTWKGQVDVLAKNGYHVWAIDFAGFGFSDKPLDKDYSLDLYRRQALDFMNAKKIKKAHLVANSMGGAVALAVAEGDPERVASMTLIDPLAYPVKLPFFYSMGKRWGAWITPFFSRNLVYKALKQVYYDEKRITEEQVEAYWLPYRMDGGREAAVKILQSFDLEILNSFSRDLKMPLFVVWGENDAWIPVSHLELFARDFPHSERRVIPCCGHAPQEEKPEELNPLLLQFLEHL